MLSDDDLSRLLLLLHRAPLEDLKWTEFLAELTTLTGTAVAALISQDGLTGEHAMLAMGGVENDPALHELYNREYAAIDPFREPFLAKMPRTLVHGDELVERGAFRAGAMYNDLLRPRKLEHGLLMPTVEPARVEVITLWRTLETGALDGDDLKLLKVLLPHVQLALQLRAALRQAERNAAEREVVTDHAAGACVLLRPGGEVSFVSRGAEAILRTRDGLMLSGRRLLASSNAGQLRLQRLLARCAGETPAGGSLLLPRSSGRAPLNLLVCPVVEPTVSGEPCRYTLVYLRDPDASVEPSWENTWSMYGFTTAEGAIARLLVEGLCPDEIAERRSTSVGTVRTQLKSLFAKTNTNRQSALVRLLMSAPRA